MSGEFSRQNRVAGKAWSLMLAADGFAHGLCAGWGLGARAQPAGADGMDQRTRGRSEAVDPARERGGLAGRRGGKGCTDDGGGAGVVRGL